MPNSSGRNGHQNGEVPPDDVLKQRLMEYAVERIPLESRIQRLGKEFNYHIKVRTLKRLHQRFNIPSARKFTLPPEDATQLVVDQVAEDVNLTHGPDKIITKIALSNQIIMPRRIAREIMHANWDEGFALRFPGAKAKKLRGQLHAVGPWHEIHADGHEKLDYKALKMGPNISIPIYAFRDKWSGVPLYLVVVPNDRLAAAIGHIYLDMIAEYQTIPIQTTFDKGTETAYTGGFQIALREEFAPDLSQEEFPAFVTLKSTDNIVIEGFWKWLRQDCGINLYTVIKEGHTSSIFHEGNNLHIALFNWIWPKIVQDLLDNFYNYWINHRVRHQKNKLLPSGMTPKEAYINPELYGGQFVGIKITNPDVIPALRETLPISHEDAFLWVSNSFDTAAKATYQEMGAPKLTILNGWQVFSLMCAKLKHHDPVILEI